MQVLCSRPLYRVHRPVKGFCRTVQGTDSFALLLLADSSKRPRLHPSGPGHYPPAPMAEAAPILPPSVTSVPHADDDNRETDNMLTSDYLNTEDDSCVDSMTCSDDGEAECGEPEQDEALQPAGQGASKSHLTKDAASAAAQSVGVTPGVSRNASTAASSVFSSQFVSSGTASSSSLLQKLLEHGQLGLVLWAKLSPADKRSLLLTGPKAVHAAACRLVSHFTVDQPALYQAKTHAELCLSLRKAVKRYPCLTHVTWKAPLSESCADTLSAALTGGCVTHVDLAGLASANADMVAPRILRCLQELARATAAVTMKGAGANANSGGGSSGRALGMTGAAAPAAAPGSGAGDGAWPVLTRGLVHLGLHPSLMQVRGARARAS